MVTTATSPPVSMTVAATPSPNVDDYGGYPQPQCLQLQCHPQPVSPPPSLHFSLRSSSVLMPTRSVSFFSLFLILCTPSSSVTMMTIAPPPFGPADHERQHIVMATSPKTVAGVALWHTYLALVYFVLSSFTVIYIFWIYYFEMSDLEFCQICNSEILYL